MELFFEQTLDKQRAAEELTRSVGDVDIIANHLNQQIDYSNEFERGKNIAAQQLFDKVLVMVKEKVNKACTNGNGQTCILCVSTSPLTQHLATFDKQYETVLLNPTSLSGTEELTLKYSMLAIFWSKKWKALFEPFQLNYKWNAKRTLLYVNLCWNNNT